MPYSKPNNNQEVLFGEKESWSEEWVGMPEYSQKNLLPNFSVRINFLTAEDFKLFSKLVDQTITTKTKSIWFPEQKATNLSKLSYVNKT